MTFRLDPSLYAQYAATVVAQWEHALEELNQLVPEEGEGAPPPGTTGTLRRETDGSVTLTVSTSDGTAHPVRLGGQRMQRLMREYTDVIGRLGGDAPAQDVETLDYAKKLVHDDAAELVADALRGLMSLDHAACRELFTLIHQIAAGNASRGRSGHRRRY